VSLRELHRLVLAAVGARSALLTVPHWLALAAAPLAAAAGRLAGRTPQFTSYSLRTIASNADISHEKARRELGYRPRALGRRSPTRRPGGRHTGT